MTESPHIATNPMHPLFAVTLRRRIRVATPALQNDTGNGCPRNASIEGAAREAATSSSESLGQLRPGSAQLLGSRCAKGSKRPEPRNR